jgi:hypothetical protein
MTLDALISLPPAGFDITSEYRLTPRPKRAFHTILDANKLLVPGSKQGETNVRLPSGNKRAVEMVLYPDLNDFVRVGSTVARLMKPLMPQYHLWFEPGPTDRGIPTSACNRS